MSENEEQGEIGSDAWEIASEGVLDGAYRRREAEETGLSLNYLFKHFSSPEKKKRPGAENDEGQGQTKKAKK